MIEAHCPTWIDITIARHRRRKPKAGAIEMRAAIAALFSD